ncbi:MAG: hypothetical protein AAF846_12720 [Chloroflexota bacterium]
MSNHLTVVSSDEQGNVPRTPYVAYHTGTGKQRKLMLRDAHGGVIGMPSYSYYVDAMAVNERYLWITFSACVYRIKGRLLLTELVPLLQDDRLKVLFCFNPLKHEPPDEDQVLIESITRHTVQELAQVRDG